MEATRIFLLAILLAVVASGCSSVEPRDHADVACEIRDDLRNLAEAAELGASAEEIERRIRLLIDKTDMLVDSACAYDDILDRFYDAYQEFDTVSRNPSSETSPSDPSFFGTRGYQPYDRGNERTPPPTIAPTVVPNTSTSLSDAERQRRLEEDANNGIREELAGVVARARLAEQDQLDPMGDPRTREDSDE